jgi:membrane-associated phospholipid phosphatase
MINVIKSLILALIVAAPCFAQPDSIKYSDGFRFADGIFYNFTGPLRWEKKDWTKFGIVLGGVSALSLVDKPMRRAWEPVDEKFLDKVNDVGDAYGRTHSALAFSGGFYIAGLVTKNAWLKETGVILGAALFTSGVIQGGLKPLIGRSRPFVEEGNYSFHPLRSSGDFHSFPSGHTSIALTITFVMARRVKSVPLKILFYSLAASTVACRLYSDAHWISDIGFGGAVAWFSAESSVRRIESMRYRRGIEPKFVLLPYPGGMTLRLRI